MNPTMNTSRRGFPSPFEIPVPPGCEGWEELYPHYLQFAESRRAFEESRFWFQDAVHYAEPYYPFDAVLPSSSWSGSARRARACSSSRPRSASNAGS